MKTQVQSSETMFKQPHMGAGAQVCNPSAGEVEADGILGLSGQPGLLGELQNTGLASDKQNKTNKKTHDVQRNDTRG